LKVTVETKEKGSEERGNLTEGKKFQTLARRPGESSTNEKEKRNPSYLRGIK